MKNTTNCEIQGQCGYCGLLHGKTKCPLVKSYEYYQDGTIKRVEFFSEDYMKKATQEIISRQPA